jgi:hypothetical protein
MRALAFKWIRILFRCWKNHEAYDDAKYVAALRRKSSPLANLLESSAILIMEILLGSGSGY